jgi:ABC-type lipoprotein export system ATPase subunit
MAINLDAEKKVALAESLKEMLRNLNQAIIVTHDDRLLHNADRVVQLERGRVIAMHDSASEVGA